MNHLERALDNQNQWWKYLFIIAAGFFAANFIGAIPLVVVIFIYSFKNGEVPASVSDNPMDLSVYGIEPNLGLFLLLLPFLIGLITIMLLFKPIHKRTIKEIINGTKSIRWKRFFFAALVWGLIMAVYLLIDYSLDPENFEIRLNFSALIPLIIISLFLIPPQSCFEEIIFRGYMTQGIAAWTRNRWIVLIIPSVLFGLMHSFNPEVETYGFWVTMPQYIIIGLLFGLVSILDDGIEVAMGAHTMNNFFTSIFITNEASSLQTNALLKQYVVYPEKELTMLIVFSIIFFFILKFKYKWKLSIMNRRVELPEEKQFSVI